MSSAYRNVLDGLRQAFPQPVSDRVHDAYFGFSFLRALDQVDQLKSIRPILGKPEILDYEAARSTRLTADGDSLEAVTEELVEHLSGMFIWGHPRSQNNVVAPPSIPSVIGNLLPSIYNPNLVSDESSRRIALAEIEALSMTAELVGYEARRMGGLFTFGGTGTLLYGLKVALEKALPGTMRKGITGRPLILCSDKAHYACRTVAGWLGIGSDSVIAVPTAPDNSIRTCLLESMLRDLYREGATVAAIVATMGTTDAFGIDDLETIDGIRQDLAESFHLDQPAHLHADAVIGWAWSVFNDYDFANNPLEFRGRTVRALAAVSHHMRHLGRADSLGIDFHKTGFAPYISSAVMFRDASDLAMITRDDEEMPYLYQSGHYHPGKFTLETSRSGGGPLAALANLKLFGLNGLRSLLGHLVSMAEVLREELESHPYTTVLNRDNYGPVTLFRVYPDGVDTFRVPDRERTDPGFKQRLQDFNRYNERIFELVHREALTGEGVVISMTDCYRETDYGEPIVALKSYIMSPFSDEPYVRSVIESVERARAQIAAAE